MHLAEVLEVIVVEPKLELDQSATKGGVAKADRWQLIVVTIANITELSFDGNGSDCSQHSCILSPWSGPKEPSGFWRGSVSRLLPNQTSGLATSIPVGACHTPCLGMQLYGYGTLDPKYGNHNNQYGISLQVVGSRRSEKSASRGVTSDPEHPSTSRMKPWGPRTLLFEVLKPRSHNI